jgi:hypothetical protein
MGEFYRKHAGAAGGWKLAAVLGFERRPCLLLAHLAQLSLEAVQALKEFIEAKITVSLCLRENRIPPNQPSRYLFCSIDLRVDVSHDRSLQVQIA